MAFTTAGPRFTSLPPDEGPGPYLGHLDLGKKKVHDHAGTLELGSTLRPGFASSETRDANPPRKWSAPPPGTYKPKDGINNYPNYESSLPRTRHAFASSEPRGWSAGAKRADGPGPGQYPLPSPFAPKRPATATVDGRSRAVAQPRKVERPLQRIKSAPSIPVGRQTLGYDESTGGLVPREVKAAPRLLQPKETLTKHNARAIRFLKAPLRSGSETARLDSKYYKPTPGPGTYQKKLFGYKGAGQYGIQLARHEKERGGGLSPAEAKLAAQLPGPGSFGYGDVKGSLAELEGDVQFARSRTDRFRRFPGPRTPGPGTYKPKKPPVRSTDLGKGDVRTKPLKPSALPGPGEYVVDKPGMGTAQEETPAWGAGAERWPEPRGGPRPAYERQSWPPELHGGSDVYAPHAPPLPGVAVYPAEPPLAYDADPRTVGAAQRARLPDANFTSGQPRDEVLRRQIARDPTKNAFGAHHLPSMGDVTPAVAYCGPGFGSAENRFPTPRGSGYPEPGAYSLERAPVAESVRPFASTESRIDLQVKWATKRAVPGPGTYRVDKMGREFTPKSFNTRFIDTA